MIKNFEKIIGWILNIMIGIIVVIIILSLYYLIQIKVLNKGYANIFGYTFFEVATGSMSDTIEIGDIVIVQLTKEVNEGEIIVYQKDNNFITHRLIQKEDEELITKGDANNTQDEPITLDNVIGKVVKIIPNLSIWKKVLSSPVIIIIITLIIVIAGFAFSHTDKEKVEKNVGKKKSKSV